MKKAIFTFASVLFICSLSCGSLSWNVVDRFPVINVFFFFGKAQRCQAAAQQPPRLIPWAVQLHFATVVRWVPLIVSAFQTAINPISDHYKVKDLPVQPAGHFCLVGYALQRSGMSGVTFKYYRIRQRRLSAALWAPNCVWVSSAWERDRCSSILHPQFLTISVLRLTVVQVQEAAATGLIITLT